MPASQKCMVHHRWAATRTVHMAGARGAANTSAAAGEARGGGAGRRSTVPAIHHRVLRL